MKRSLQRALRRRLANPIVRATLRSRLHRLLSGALILVTYTGRRSAREFTIPVMYVQTGARLVVFVGDAEHKQWWRNLRGGAPVEVQLRGSRHRGHAVAVRGSAGELDAPLREYLARFPKAARAVQQEDPLVMVLVDLAPE
ncbi:MAG: nitroreductase family deazaflavin-dependent oxidoreductase, partial [Thermoleophilia bacterium]|nr:nitroreductase family deazaflavin-dependent oxidoreductase [Thermoleophilia bacterium]